MNRYTSSEAIILENRRIGEQHKGLTLFTPDEGIVRAIAYGGYSHKGSLRGVTAVYTHGTAFLYHEPARGRTKLSDIEVRSMFHGIREDVLRFYTAGLWAEMVLRSFGGGEASADLFRLLLEGLTLLDAAEEERTRVLSAQVQLRYLSIAGAPVDPDHVRDPDVRPFVEAAYSHSLAESLAVPPPAAELTGIQRALFRRLERVVEGPLRTVRSSGGIL
ncbi:MAG: DNA repair protein RecO [Spirochaetales bacterium]